MIIIIMIIIDELEEECLMIIIVHIIDEKIMIDVKNQLLTYMRKKNMQRKVPKITIIMSGILLSILAFVPPYLGYINMAYNFQVIL